MHWSWIKLTLALVFLLLLGVFGMRSAYLRESEQRARQSVYGPEMAKFGVDVYATMVDVDPLKQLATVRLAFLPLGPLADKQGNLAQPLHFYCNTLSGPQDHDFPAGLSMSPFEMSVNLFDGQSADYPFDRYGAQVECKLSSGPDQLAVPLRLVFLSTVNGIKVVSDQDRSAPGYVSANFKLSRSDTVIATAVSGMLVMWALGLSVLSLALTIIVTNEHLNSLTFLSGLLFALFSFRNSLPGTPPVGALSDFLAFFWVEAIVALSLVVVLVLNVRKELVRPSSGKEAAPENPQPEA